MIDWNCPFCDRAQTATRINISDSYRKLSVGTSWYGDLGVRIMAFRCLSSDCNEVTLSASLHENKEKNGIDFAGDSIQRWSLRPQGDEKPQPDYIPKVIVEDYREACLIAELSPKASATLARRCLQGMIRDFCGISKGTLNSEILELVQQLEAGTAPKGVDAESIQAIDAVRHIGNIGAHMERDIGMIIDVEPDEARSLIALIEMLFKDWYVARHDRKQRLEAVQAMARDKKNKLDEMKAKAAERATEAK